MININRSAVDGLSKTASAKTLKGKDNNSLYPAFSNSQTNLLDMVRDYSVYEMAHWTNYTDRFCHSRKTPNNNSRNYKRGTIVFVDLGAGNFGHEPSYTHPAVVIQENKFQVFIAPCSSKKYGKGISTVIDATTADGFSGNTGIQTDSIRWISKDRIISKLGKVSNTILDALDRSILDNNPTYKKECVTNTALIASLQNDNTILQTNEATLRNDNTILQADNTRLTTELADTQNDNAILQTENTRLMTELTDTQNNNTILQTENTRLMTELADVQKKLNQLPGLLEKLEESQIVTPNELSELRSIIESFHK